MCFERKMYSKNVLEKRVARLSFNTFDILIVYIYQHNYGYFEHFTIIDSYVEFNPKMTRSRGIFDLL